MITQQQNTDNQHDLQIKKNSCTRCGICCKKGGPSIHFEDRDLIEKGNIPLKYLFTIRPHEPLFDNVKERIEPAKTDIIKIKNKKNSHECIFYDPDHSGCQIYEDRPLECRKLTCWDTKEILSLYDTTRISRKELVFSIDELWNLVQHHQDRCSYQKVETLAGQVKENKNNHTALQKLNDIIQYDSSLRQLIIEKNPMISEKLEFLFGRPLTLTISLYGLKLKQSSGIMEENNNKS
ncbi:MAG: YkgJ family cysteine cluster protein [Deltaproteobacteria bacterium]|nr:MAG: YkgJ family cysteine cluster protein [Deltaproteobacteria bacterium]